MKQKSTIKRTIIPVLVVSLGLIAFLCLNNQNARGTTNFIHVSGTAYQFGSEDISSVILNSSDSILYASLYQDGLIIEVDCATMTTIRSFQIAYPEAMTLSNDELFLYVESGWEPGYINKIRLSDGFTDSIPIEGEPEDLVVDFSNDRLWVMHRTWPLDGDEVMDINDDAPANSGIITEIDLNSFSIACQQPVMAIPTTIIYSPETEKLFVLHALTDTTVDFFEVWDKDETGIGYDIVSSEWEKISVYDVSNPGAIGLISENLKGGSEAFAPFSPQLELWTDSGSHIAVPNAIPYKPEFSLRIFNSENFSHFDLFFPDANSQAIGCYYLHKVPSENILWSTSGSGEADFSRGWSLIGRGIG